MFQGSGEVVGTDPGEKCSALNLNLQIPEGKRVFTKEAAALNTVFTDAEKTWEQRLTLNKINNIQSMSVMLCSSLLLLTWTTYLGGEAGRGGRKKTN